MKNLGKIHYGIIGAWFVINLLQAIFTGLHSDESYYWMYSQNLDWGYFDHPPMAAFFIWLGHALLPGEIGVRLFMILLSTITFALLLNEINEKQDFYFLVLFMLSFPLIHTHIAGFLAIPDIPLLFFTVIFLLLYKQFIEKPGWGISVLLGITSAAMIYSKYHAFLVIGFTLLSNLKLLKSKYTYAIVIISAILLIPHALWQINNDFPTFKYHLVERSKPFQFKYIFPYLSGILLVAGPLSGILVFWKLSKIKPEMLFQSALIFNIIGFIALFFVMSFKNRIEIHWLAAIIPMIMILSYPMISGDPKIKKWFIRLSLPVIVLFFLYRIYLALDVIPNIGNLKITFYNRESNAMQIKQMAGEKTVGFYNNYAAISNYMFYTGDSAVYLTTHEYRFCQYDLWNFEQFAHGKTIMAIQSKHMNPTNLTPMTTGEIKGFIVLNDFQSLKGLLIHINSFEETVEKILFDISLENSTYSTIFTRHASEPAIVIAQHNNVLCDSKLAELIPFSEIPPGKKVNFQIAIPKKLMNENNSLTVYTKTKENYRGELVPVKNKSLSN